MRYLRHVKAPVRTQGERTMQLNIIRKDSTPSGQEELNTESVTVTVKEGAEEPVPTKPGTDSCLTKTGFKLKCVVCPDATNTLWSLCRRKADNAEAPSAVCHGPKETGGEGTQG